MDSAVCEVCEMPVEGAQVSADVIREGKTVVTLHFHPFCALGYARGLERQARFSEAASEGDYAGPRSLPPDRDRSRPHGRLATAIAILILIGAAYGWIAILAGVVHLNIR